MIRETSFQVHRICVIVFLKPDRWTPGICMLPSMSERFLCIFSKSGAGMSGGVVAFAEAEVRLWRDHSSSDL